jgi:hypothetical protein
MTKTLMLCSCAGSVPWKRENFDGIDEVNCPKLFQEMCGRDAAEAMRLFASQSQVVVACA